MSSVSINEKLSGNVDVERRRLYLFSEIDGNSAREFIIALNHLDQTDGDIVVAINSEGGNETDGYAIYDTVMMCRNRIIMEGYGEVSSIAAAIFQAGDVRLISQNCEFMIHHGSIGGEESMKQDAVVELAEQVRLSSERYYKVLSQKSAQSFEALEAWCRVEKIFAPAETVDAGFADAIMRPIPENAVVIQLGKKGHTAFIDKEDEERVAPHSWNVGNGRYAHSGSFVDESGKQKWVKMHRFIMDALDEETVDHINGDTFDNRRCNLRKCSIAENARNRNKAKSATSSKFKGVYRRKNGWAAKIQVNKKSIYLGVFEEEIDAAKAYDEAARQYHGSFAKTNFTLIKDQK